MCSITLTSTVDWFLGIVFKIKRIILIVSIIAPKATDGGGRSGDTLII